MRSVIAVVLLFFVLPARAEIKTMQEFNQWMTSYYQHPAPDKVAESLKAGYTLGFFQDTRKTGAPLFGFIAGLTRQDPALATQLTEDLASFDDERYAVVLTGIWYAHMPQGESEKIVASALAKRPALATSTPYLKRISDDILAVPIERGPWVLDAMWGYFFATGDSAPVIRVMSALPWLDASKKQEVMKAGKRGAILLATAGAARWSLTANAKQHARVYDICREQMTRQPDIISQQLVQIVMNAKK